MDKQELMMEAKLANLFNLYIREQLKAVGYPSYIRVKEMKDRSKEELRIEAILPDIWSVHI